MGMRERQVGSQDYEWESVLLTCLSERDVKSTRAYTVNRRSERVESYRFYKIEQPWSSGVRRRGAGRGRF